MLSHSACIVDPPLIHYHYTIQSTFSSHSSYFYWCGKTTVSHPSGLLAWEVGMEIIEWILRMASSIDGVLVQYAYGILRGVYRIEVSLRFVRNSDCASNESSEGNLYVLFGMVVGHSLRDTSSCTYYTEFSAHSTLLGFTMLCSAAMQSTMLLIPSTLPVFLFLSLPLLPKTPPGIRNTYSALKASPKEPPKLA